MKISRQISTFWLVTLLLTSGRAAAGTDRPLPRASLRVPAAVAAVDIDEKLGARLPLSLSFTDSAGRPTRLGELFDGRKPVVLVLAYYRCPMLCDLVLSGISTSLRKLGWALGTDYRGVTVSIDPHDTPVAAHHKQVAVLQAMNESGPSAEATRPAISSRTPRWSWCSRPTAACRAISTASTSGCSTCGSA